jgi:hypothetical protein
MARVRWPRVEERKKVNGLSVSGGQAAVRWDTVEIGNSIKH